MIEAIPPKVKPFAQHIFEKFEEEPKNQMDNNFYNAEQQVNTNSTHILKKVATFIAHASNLF